MSPNLSNAEILNNLIEGKNLDDLSARSLMQEWFMQNCIWSIKDQLSFPYVLAKSGFSYSLFPGTVAENDHFDWCWKERESSLSNT